MEDAVYLTKGLNSTDATVDDIENIVKLLDNTANANITLTSNIVRNVFQCVDNLNELPETLQESQAAANR